MAKKPDPKKTYLPKQLSNLPGGQRAMFRCGFCSQQNYPMYGSMTEVARYNVSKSILNIQYVSKCTFCHAKNEVSTDVEIPKHAQVDPVPDPYMESIMIKPEKKEQSPFKKYKTIPGPGPKLKKLLSPDMGRPIKSDYARDQILKVRITKPVRDLVLKLIANDYGNISQADIVEWAVIEYYAKHFKAKK